jgi:hypothetical protein
MTRDRRQLPWTPGYHPGNSIPDAFAVPDLIPNPDQPSVIKHSLQVREKRIALFPPDQAIPASSNVTLQRGSGLPAGCTGFRFISVVANVAVSVNGGGPRTVLDGDMFNGAEVLSLQIQTDATGSCILQTWGEGDA